MGASAHSTPRLPRPSPTRGTQSRCSTRKADGLTIQCTALTIGRHTTGGGASTGYHSGTAFMVYDWLRQRSFDVVHFPDWQGHGYFSLLAKHLGTDFARTTMCCMVHGPLYWARTSNEQGLDTLEDIETDFLERGSIRTAELLISPSHYLINWIVNQTWEVPEIDGAIRTQPYILPHEAKRVVAKVNAESSAPPLQPWARTKVWEFCFFGRLEVRKGIVLFADAIDALLAWNRTHPQEAGLAEAIAVTFLGSDRNTILGAPSRQYIARRAVRWGPAVTASILTDKDSAQALAYLKQPGRLALMPSLVENSPLSILELMGAEIPFLASTAGGIPELIHQDFRAEVLFEPRAEDLVQKLVAALRRGAVVAAPHYDMDEVERSWVDFHAAEAAKHAAVQNAVGAEEDGGAFRAPSGGCSSDDSLRVCRAPIGNATFTTSVVVTASRGGAALQVSVESVLQQQEADGAPARGQLIVVCTAAGAGPEASLGTQLANRWADAGGVWLNAKRGATLAEARNSALESVTGDLVLFLDAGCMLEAFALKTLLGVYRQTGAAAVSSFAKAYQEPVPSGTTAAGLAATAGAEKWFQVYLGSSSPIGVFRNAFGGPVVLFSTAALRDMGGFRPLPNGYDHWELLARFSLKELRHEVVPQVLAWVPASAMSGVAVHEFKKNQQWRELMRPYAEAKQAGFPGAHWRTAQSVDSALRLLGAAFKVDLLANPGALMDWLAGGAPSAPVEAP
uniref:Glycosyl transferase family 1 n=1 Tax=Tetraselmis sp. GSL018 TaxID=582737 RepID=A0A061SGY1_9CHLO